MAVVSSTRGILPTLGARVRTLRLARGLTQKALAAEAGSVYQVINGIERGRQSLYVDLLVRLALALDTSTDYLLGLTDSPAPRLD